MAGSATDYLENRIVDHAFTGKTAYTKPTVHIALFTVAPTDSTAGTEVTGNAYARVATTGASWNAASGGVATNASAFTFPAATPGNWGTVVAVGGFDASTGGNLLWVDGGIAPIVVNAGDPAASIAAGALSISQT